MDKKLKKSLFAKVAVLFFTRWRLSFLLFAIIIGFGGLAYTKLINREGFPSIQFPVSFVNGIYIANDKDVIDREVAQPFYELVGSMDIVDRVSTVSNANNFSATIFYKDGVLVDAGTARLNQLLTDNKEKFPEEVQFNTLAIKPSAYQNKYDLLLSVYGEDSNPEKLQEVAKFVSSELTKNSSVESADAELVINEVSNPQTGEKGMVQTGFNRIGLKNSEGVIQYHSAITIGVIGTDAVDVLELSDAVKSSTSQIDLSSYGDGYEVVISADFADNINSQISSLQSNLFTGLLAVALVTLLLITWRASIITAVFMVAVMAMTVAILFLVGYTLNTITLFALVLSLGLFVDDATIVVESIDAHRKKKMKAVQIIRASITKVGAASFAGSFTTILVFVPLAFISGVLGEFIRLMPITVIIALISSFTLAMTLIPVLSKFLLLKHKKDGWLTTYNPISRLEKYIGAKVASIPRLLVTNKSKGRFAATFMVALSLVAVLSGLFFARSVPFNIFPPSKDSDQIGINLTYPAGYTIADAENAAKVAEQQINLEVGNLGTRVSYGSFSLIQSNERSAELLLELVPFNERDRKSPDIIENLLVRLDDRLPAGVTAKVRQFDAGPPVEDYPFKVQIYSEDSRVNIKLANEISNFIDGAKLVRANGSSATINNINEVTDFSVNRKDSKQFIELGAGFDADDTSALLVAAQKLVSDKFTESYLANNGYSFVKLEFDFGQESQNADSFSALGLIFPIALGLMYVLLVLQFKSFLQPLLIFMAIPFTFFGVFGGLIITGNSLSFFVMVGLIGLIGIAVNNTILLTAYANQEKEAGEGSIDAISNAVAKRFRPLLATTLTTIVALLPLALADPFWEALAYTIIFGLASSTLFVLISFPYFYLAAELLRNKTRRKSKRVSISK